jgi:hypothetical protein
MPLTDVSNATDEAKNLANFLQEVLNRVITVYGSYSMPLPSRRYYTMAAPVVDCEQVCVSFIQMYVGTPGDEATEPKRCHDPRTATISIQVARAVPITQNNGQAPRADDIQDAAYVSALDAWVLMESINNLDTWAVNGPFGLGVIATVDADPPEGGFQTTRMTLTMAVP